MLHTLQYQVSSNTVFWSQIKSNLNFTNECNVQLIFIYAVRKSIFQFITDLYLNKISTALQYLHDVWLILLLENVKYSYSLAEIYNRVKLCLC